MDPRAWNRGSRPGSRRPSSQRLGPVREPRQSSSRDTSSNLQLGIIIVLAIMFVLAILPIISGVSLEKAIAKVTSLGYSVLSADEVGEFVKRLGRSGGQLVTGGTGAGEDLDLRTTSDPTKGSYLFTELNCTGNSNGGALTVGTTGALACSDDDTGGGAASNSFETVGVSTGTSPVADSGTDTLTLNDSVTVSASGSATSDSLSWHLVSPSCADSSGQHLNYSGGLLVCGTTTGNAPTATALAANGSNCAATQAPLGVDTLGAVESCFQTITTGGRSLTVTGTDIVADTELYTDTKNINITSPGTGVTNRAQFTFAQATTITEVACSVDVGTLTIQLDERARATPNTAGTNIMTSSLVCDTDTQATTAFDNAGIAADAPVNLQVTAVSGSPAIVRLHIKHSYDD